MKTPPDEIWSALLRETAPDDFRQAVLDTTLACVGRRRYWRRACYGCLMAAGLVATVFLITSFYRKAGRSEPNWAGATHAPEYIPGTKLRVISDEELLALFKGPRALVGPPGHRQLVLLGESRQ